ncbi:hypothetical protein KC361_g203 [Hortaea werneckii]|nr:hypothetical protein KC361_g203 [Hortaea werneckii]
MTHGVLLRSMLSRSSLSQFHCSFVENRHVASLRAAFARSFSSWKRCQISRIIDRNIWRGGAICNRQLSSGTTPTLESVKTYGNVTTVPRKSHSVIDRFRQLPNGSFSPAASCDMRKSVREDAIGDAWRLSQAKGVFGLTAGGSVSLLAVVREACVNVAFVICWSGMGECNKNGNAGDSENNVACTTEELVLLQRFAVKGTDSSLQKLVQVARQEGFNASPLLITTSVPASTATVNVGGGRRCSKLPQTSEPVLVARCRVGRHGDKVPFSHLLD